MGEYEMLRREFLVGVSSVPMVKTEDAAEPSVQEAIEILEKAVRREFDDVEEVRVSFNTDAKQRIAMLFAVVRCCPVSPLG